jgi:GNAT superfamily N-acetyltransferase
VADALDADPFVLLLLRGRTRDQVLAGVRTRRRGTPDEAQAAAVAGSRANAGRAANDKGVDARDAFDEPLPWAKIPAPPLPPARPGQPAALPVDPPAWRAGLGSDLLELAADAAARAWEMAVGLSADAGLGLSADADLARRAARVLGTPSFGPIAARSGIGARELVRQALAWRQGGLAGLELLGGEWDAVADEPESADLLKAAGNVLHSKTGEAQSVQGNRVTAGRLQLRLGRDLRWYPYARSDGDWEPSGPPQADPAEAVASL